DVQDIVRPGGAIFWLSECAGGISKGFMDWAAIDSDDALEKAVRANYSLTGHNSLMLRQLTRRLRVGLYSKLPQGAVRQLSMQPLASLQEGLAWLRGQCPGNFTYAVVPCANIMCATVDSALPQQIHEAA